jgi:PAS domain-containing protein
MDCKLILQSAPAVSYQRSDINRIEALVSMNAKLKRQIPEIRSSAPETESLVESIAIPAAIMDSSLRIFAANKFAVELTGFSAEDFSREPSLWRSRVFPADRADYS